MCLKLMKTYQLIACETHLIYTKTKAAAAKVTAKIPSGQVTMLVLARPLNWISLVISEKFRLILEFQMFSISGM